MFTPELTNEKNGTLILMTNHASRACVVRSKVVAEPGEAAVRRRLNSLNVFDLYEGHWRYV